MTTQLSTTVHTGRQEAKGSGGLDPRQVAQPGLASAQSTTQQRGTSQHCPGQPSKPSISPAQPSSWFRGLALSPRREVAPITPLPGRPRRYPVDKVACISQPSDAGPSRHADAAQQVRACQRLHSAAANWQQLLQPPCPQPRSCSRPQPDHRQGGSEACGAPRSGCSSLAWKSLSCVPRPVGAHSTEGRRGCVT